MVPYASKYNDVLSMRLEYVDLLNPTGGDPHTLDQGVDKGKEIEAIDDLASVINPGLDEVKAGTPGSGTC